MRPKRIGRSRAFFSFRGIMTGHLAGIGTLRRWKQLRRRQLSIKNIQEMIETNAKTLGEAARRNAARWAGATGYYPDKLSFEEDVSQMKAWIGPRLQWLDGEIQRRVAN